MSRPKPRIILTRTDSKTYKAEQVLEAMAIYAVFFDGRPINLRSVHTTNNDIGPKYKKCSFSNRGHAFNLRDKLNVLFKTTRFSVYMLKVGDKVEEIDDCESSS